LQPFPHLFSLPCSVGSIHMHGNVQNYTLSAEEQVFLTLEISTVRVVSLLFRLVEVKEWKSHLLGKRLGLERRGHTSTLVGSVIYTIGGLTHDSESNLNVEVSSDVGLQ
jgi:hypothetical protein